MRQSTAAASSHPTTTEPGDAPPDDNPRPHKRQRIHSTTTTAHSQADHSTTELKTPTNEPEPSGSSPARNISSKANDPLKDDLKPLPPAILLVSLPSLLAHPPNHRFYVHSLVLSLTALRKCLALPALSPEIECRAWTGLAEVGMRVISGGLSGKEDYPWAGGIESEVEKALSRGSIIAQKHPSLRAYKHQLALLQAQLSQWQHKTKFARNQIRNLITSFLTTDPPHIVYSAQLLLINFLTTPYSTHNSDANFPSGVKKPSVTRSPAPPSSPQPTAQDVYAALAAVQELAERAVSSTHNQVAILARVLRVRILIAASIWAEVEKALKQAEAALGLSYEPMSTPKSRKPLQPSQGTVITNSGGDGDSQKRTHAPVQEQTFIMFEDPFEAAMAVHLLMLSVVYYTQVGQAAEVSPRLSHLHALLDSEVLEKFPDGHVEIALPGGPSLVVQVTHPRILYLLAFLVSSASKRDAVGRKPKRKVFAAEGLAIWEQEASRELSLPVWADIGDVQEVEERLVRIKADLLCELVAVSTMRSEWDIAEENLNILVAHVRTYDIFPLFAARIALHHAHLAHALARPARALRCYRAAIHHSAKDSFVHAAASASEIALRIGIRRLKVTKGKDWRDGLSEADDEWPEDDDDDDDDEDLEQRGAAIIKECRGMGGILEALSQVLEACFSPEILKAKQHLKYALEIATKAQDNHLRALVLALITAHYLHTAGDHARSMLQTCEQLAAGLGAPPIKGATAGGEGSIPVVVGNAPLGLWAGERFLELFKRFGKDSKSQKQAVVNAQFAKAMESLARRPDSCVSAC